MGVLNLVDNIPQQHQVEFTGNPPHVGFIPPVGRAAITQFEKGGIALLKGNAGRCIVSHLIDPLNSLPGFACIVLKNLNTRQRFTPKHDDIASYGKDPDTLYRTLKKGVKLTFVSDYFLQPVYMQLCKDAQPANASGVYTLYANEKPPIGEDCVTDIDNCIEIKTGTIEDLGMKMKPKTKNRRSKNQGSTYKYGWPKGPGNTTGGTLYITHIHSMPF